MTTKAFYYTVAVLLMWVLAWLPRSARTRQLVFLVASYTLYALWSPVFLAILVLSTLANYGFGVLLRRGPSAIRLWIGIAFNIALLGTFKYLPAVAASWAPHSEVAAKLSSIVLPIGISFWTFEALSYLLDVYRGEDLDPSLLEFCLYLAFWPTVLSGPICRLPNLLPQLRQDFAPSKDALRNGVNRILIGLFMTAVAQTLAAGIKSGQGVDAAFSSTSTAWSGTDVWCLAIAYGFQLFLDFAGYSHVVIGAARLFGIRLEENFNNPYLSTTPSMFWTRWHMSLSSWIRDYLFLPLATARRELWWRNLALAISMVIFGLWHKGSLLFLIWGVYQGVLLMLHRQWQQFQRWSGFSWAGYVAAPVSWLVTFAAMSLGWIFFRANDLHQARTMWAAVVNLGSYGQLALPRSLYLLTAIVVVGYFCVVGIKWLLEREPQVQFRIPVEFRFAAYAVMFYWAMLHIAEPQAFIYFQF